MRHFLVNREDYQHTVDINTCQVPADLTHLRMEHKSLDEDGKVFHSANYEMFLSKDQIKDLIKSLEQFA
jgi:hypothetical protein